MKKYLSVVLLALLALLPARVSRAQDAPPADVQPAIEKIKDKIKAGKDKEADLADNLKELDALMAKYKTKSPEDAAGIGMVKVQIYLQVLENDDKAIATLKQIKTDFPSTKAAGLVDGALVQIQAAAAANKIERSLVPGTKFPEFNVKDLAGNPLSIARFKGKVLLVDFWATWCGPCVHELPNVLEVYGKHHSQGFEVVGISLDSDANKLQSFIKAQKVEWPQFFDGQGWSNQLAQKYGIQSIPATFLLDGNGMIIARDVRGDALEQAVAKALKK